MAERRWLLLSYFSLCRIERSAFGSSCVTPARDETAGPSVLPAVFLWSTENRHSGSSLRMAGLRIHVKKQKFVFFLFEMFLFGLFAYYSFTWIWFHLPCPKTLFFTKKKKSIPYNGALCSSKVFVWISSDLTPSLQACRWEPGSDRCRYCYRFIVLLRCRKASAFHFVRAAHGFQFSKSVIYGPVCYRMLMLIVCIA